MCLATHCHEGKVAGTKVITVHAEEVKICTCHETRIQKKKHVIFKPILGR